MYISGLSFRVFIREPGREISEVASRRVRDSVAHRTAELDRDLPACSLAP